METSKDTLGDRLKAVEQVEAGRKCDPNKPIIARLDGRAFHTFTKGLERPYDTRLSQLMIDTTAYLVDKTHAIVGYTQSDEISLCWDKPSAEGEFLFDGKIQKLTSVLASLATSYFAKNRSRLPEKEHLFPTFDCRVWQVEDMREVYLNYLWRQDDAIKNSISMAAQAHFPHKQLQNVSGSGKKVMLLQKGINWNDYPTFFKSGTFVKRVAKMVTLTDEQLSQIPEQYRPTGPVQRSFVEDVGIEELRTYFDPQETLFEQFPIQGRKAE